METLLPSGEEQIFTIFQVVSPSVWMWADPSRIQIKLFVIVSGHIQICRGVEGEEEARGDPVDPHRRGQLCSPLFLSIYGFHTSASSVEHVGLGEHVAHSLQQANYCLKTDEILRNIQAC